MSLEGGEWAWRGNELRGGNGLGRGSSCPAGPGKKHRMSIRCGL